MNKKNIKYIEVVLIIVIGFGLLINLRQIRKAQTDLLKIQKEIHMTMYPEKYYDVSTFKKIDYKKFMELYESKELSVVFVGSSTCSYCHRFAPVLTEVSKAKKEQVYYLEISKLKEEELLKIMELNEEFKTNFAMTPYTVAIKDKKVIKSLPGAFAKSEVEYFFDDIKQK